MNRAAVIAAAVGALLLPPAAACAHGLDTSVRQGAAVVVTATYEDGSPMAFEACEVLPPGDRPVFQVGRTDRLGRVAFLPDRPGEWRVRVTSEDGHGAVMPVTVDEGMIAAASAPRGGGRGWKLATGLGMLFGVFGLLNLTMQRRKG